MENFVPDALRKQFVVPDRAMKRPADRGGSLYNFLGKPHNNKGVRRGSVAGPKDRTLTLGRVGTTVRVGGGRVVIARAEPLRTPRADVVLRARALVVDRMNYGLDRCDLNQQDPPEDQGQQASAPGNEVRWGRPKHGGTSLSEDSVRK